MKKMMFQTVSVLFLMIAVTSCNSGEKKPGTPAGDTAAPKQDPPVSGQANTSATGAATVEFVKAMVAKDWKAVDGQEVTVAAYPLGMEKAPKNGEFLLYLDDKQGGSSLNFAASFKEEMREEVKKHKGDAMITVTGNIGTPNGITVLKNARIVN